MPRKERTYNGLAVGDVVHWCPEAEQKIASDYKGFTLSNPGPFVVSAITENDLVIQYGAVKITTADGTPVIRKQHHDYSNWWCGFFVTNKFLTEVHKALKRKGEPCQKPNHSPSKTA